LTCFCAKRVCWATFSLERVFETEGLAFYQLEMADGVFRCFIQVLISQVGWLSTWPAVRAWSCQGPWPSKWGRVFYQLTLSPADSGRLPMPLRPVPSLVRAAGHPAPRRSIAALRVGWAHHPRPGQGWIGRCHGAGR